MTEQIKQYYRQRVTNNDCDKLLWQVGKTINGQEVPVEQLRLIVKTIASRLQFTASDTALDIGCANGLLTKEFSGHVEKITGLELTPELYETARRCSFGPNISYVNGNILELAPEQLKCNFTKVYLYEVIQHMSYREADQLFAILNDLVAANALIFIGGILDSEKKWSFFNNTERRRGYFTALLDGTDPLGTWYHRDFLACLASRHNFTAECIDQDGNLYTSHYRFDCLLRKCSS